MPQALPVQVLQVPQALPALSVRLAHLVLVLQVPQALPALSVRLAHLVLVLQVPQALPVQVLQALLALV